MVYTVFLFHCITYM